MKIILLSFFIFLSFFNLNTFAEELILKIEPQNNYEENMKYEEIEEYKETKKKKKESKLDIDVDVGVNKDEKAIDKLKLDMGKSF